MSRTREIRVANVTALCHGEARTFSFEVDGERVEGFILYIHTEAFRGHVAYRNRCAHVGFDLDMGTGVFWSPKTQRIYCRTHGARFEPTTGICDFGPCVGAGLQRFAVRLDGDDAIVVVDGEGTM